MNILHSIDPATGETVWAGPAATRVGCAAAVERAQAALPRRSALAFAWRAALARAFAERLSGRPDFGHSRTPSAASPT